MPKIEELKKWQAKKNYRLSGDLDLNDLAKWAEIKGQRLEEMITATLIDISNQIIEATPVGNPDLWVTQNSSGEYVDYVSYLGYPDGYSGGTLRANWYASIGSPSSESDESNQDETRAEVDVKREAKDAFGNTYYLTNNLPYAMPVEYGWSTQAPRGMVRLSVRRAKTALKRAIRNAI